MLSVRLERSDAALVAAFAMLGTRTGAGDRRLME